jgi:hypothetical protein
MRKTNLLAFDCSLLFGDLRLTVSLPLNLKNIKNLVNQLHRSKKYIPSGGIQ